MEKITIVEKIDAITQEVIEHVIIDHGNDQFTSMTKATYDEQQAALKDAPKL